MEMIGYYIGQTFGYSIGLLVTIVSGALCSTFLSRSVAVQFPKRFEKLQSAEESGGGRQLGMLERLVFFTSFSVRQHEVAAGWLLFKVAAKWASWQHVAKIPEGEENDLQYTLDKVFLSSRMLGRFLNGSAFNLFCAAVGVAVVPFAQQLIAVFDWSADRTTAVGVVLICLDAVLILAGLARCSKVSLREVR
jgi:hypothetical protein